MSLHSSRAQLAWAYSRLLHTTTIGQTLNLHQSLKTRPAQLTTSGRSKAPHRSIGPATNQANKGETLQHHTQPFSFATDPAAPSIMSTEPLIFSEMRLQQVGTLVFIQPVQNSAVAGPSLTVELGTGTVGLAEHSVPLKGTDTIYGVIGLARFLGGCALAVITDAEQVSWMT